ncbi:hypothetical protein TK0400 [Thermococcus kodakarensis KOD1]|uniref:Uncharacterized protein n=1 Tax=Thermococcus kodakarensis (strain ATCC BAA-918 / JCM 12380 / KOD1) TaxID=69014 RepID=Q5JG85_THEKO|nr:hypothetical protein [Thermococcus kodakarensis]WCN28471.1 hypothetical protein POG15_02045 [Thermococcus kodakarensis]WCN30767.1 hypothetical protein POG21_02045 [Thermococcus kodakarensis]BAD84589.1 hypothetical protein TK0400 [Thermococcus kodakarensis KOD1]
MMPARIVKKNKTFYHPFEKVFSYSNVREVRSDLIIAEKETLLDDIINELREHYGHVFHESVYTEDISENKAKREDKIKAIAEGILKTIKEVPHLKRLVPMIKVAIDLNEDYNTNFFYIIVSLRKDKIEEAADAFDKLEENILSKYPDKDIRILYTLQSA